MTQAQDEKQTQAKLCFVICPFGPPESPQRKRSNMLLEYLITPAAAEFGYTVIRADLSAEPGVVTIFVIQHLIEDALLVADITDRNPNVFYELAIRHAIRKPFIQLIKEGDNIPFNIQGVQTIEYDLSDVEKIRQTLDTMKKQILHYETTGKVTSPVSVAIDSLMGTTSLEHFRAIMDRLNTLDSSVASAEEMRRQIVFEVKSLVDEVRLRLDSEAYRAATQITERMSKQPHGHSAPVVDYDFNRDDQFSSLLQKETRRHKGEFTIGEWLRMEQRKWKK